MTLPAAHRYALTFFSICLSAIIGYPSLLAASGPCGVGGCLNNATNYITNQGGGMGSCNNTTLPANKETQVASGNAGSYSANPWVYGVSGQVLLYNGSLAEKNFYFELVYWRSNGLRREAIVLQVDQHLQERVAPVRRLSLDPVYGSARGGEHSRLLRVLCRGYAGCANDVRIASVLHH